MLILFAYFAHFRPIFQIFHHYIVATGLPIVFVVVFFAGIYFVAEVEIGVQGALGVFKATNYLKKSRIST